MMEYAEPSRQQLFRKTEIEVRNRVLVMGVGSAGCNMAAHVRETWDDGNGPDVIAVNTDAQALAACSLDRCVLLGKTATQGMGTAGDPDAGRMAAEECTDELSDLIANYDLVFLLVGLGGGTGTGAGRYIASLARKLDVLTLCFATLPFPFEGDQRIQLAEEGLRNLQREADAVIRLANEKLLDLVDPQTGLNSAFRASDEQVGICIATIWQLLTDTGVINLDFADIRQVAQRSGGLCQFGYGEGRGSRRASEALSAITSHPYLDKGASLAEASALMINMKGGPDLTLADIQGIVGQLAGKAQAGVRVFMGATIHPGWRERLAVSVLVAENWIDRSSVRAAADALGEYMEDQLERVRSGEEPGGDPVTGKPVQEDLAFENGTRGRFEKVEPTIYKGQDLDIPTYIRRNIKLSFEK